MIEPWEIKLLEATDIDFDTPNSKNLSLIKIIGDSMNTNINYNGKQLYLNTDIQHKPLFGEVVLVRINGHYYTKQILLYEGRIMLHSFNPKFKDYIVDDSDDFKIIGIVEGLM
jgi:SOS-response transcriptional repressor LexA